MAMGNFSGIVLEEAAEITEDQWRALGIEVSVNRHLRALREHGAAIRIRQQMRWRFHQQWLDRGRYAGESVREVAARIRAKHWAAASIEPDYALMFREACNYDAVGMKSMMLDSVTKLGV